MAISRAHSFWQFSLIFYRDKNYVIKSEIVLIASEFLISAKFRKNVKIPRQRENSAAWLEIPRPTENWGL